MGLVHRKLHVYMRRKMGNYGRRQLQVGTGSEEEPHDLARGLPFLGISDSRDRINCYLAEVYFEVYFSFCKFGMMNFFIVSTQHKFF